LALAELQEAGDSDIANLEARSFESPHEVRPFTDKGEAKIVKLSSGYGRIGDVRAAALK